MCGKCLFLACTTLLSCLKEMRHSSVASTLYRPLFVHQCPDPLLMVWGAGTCCRPSLMSNCALLVFYIGLICFWIFVFFKVMEIDEHWGSVLLKAHKMRCWQSVAVLRVGYLNNHTVIERCKEDPWLLWDFIKKVYCCHFESFDLNNRVKYGDEFITIVSI